MDRAKRNKILWTIGGILVGLLILLVVAYNIALSSDVICDYWLPMVSRRTGQNISASEVRLSLFSKGNNLAVKNLRYSNGKGLDAVVDQADGSIDFMKAASGEYLVNGFRVNGAHVKMTVAAPATPPSGAPVSAPDSASAKHTPPAEKISAPEPKKELKLLIRNVELKNIVAEYEDVGKGISCIYELDSLTLNQFGAGQVSDIRLISRLKTALKKTTLKIAPLPLTAKIQLKSAADLMPEFVTADLESNNTGLEAPAVELANLAVPRGESNGNLPPLLRKCKVRYSIDLKDIVVADRMKISVGGRMELADLVCKVNPLNVDVNGMKCMFGGEVNAVSQHFHVAGKSGMMDVSPLLNSLMKAGRNPISLVINSLDFNMKGQGFSELPLKKSLTGNAVLKASDFSIPMELYQSNDLTRLIMIPLKAIPTLLNMIPYEHALKSEAVSGAKSLDNIFSGKLNLEFSSVELDLAAENGLLNIKNFSLTGNQVASEVIAGTVNLPTGAINLLTQTNLLGLTIPFRIKGSMNSPQPDYADALANLLKAVTVNVLQDAAQQLVKKLNSNPAVGKQLNINGKDLEKNVEKGLNQLNNWLNNKL